jgi:hypothetical protein
MHLMKAWTTGKLFVSLLSICIWLALLISLLLQSPDQKVYFFFTGTPVVEWFSIRVPV